MLFFKKKQSLPTRRARHLMRDAVDDGATSPRPVFQRNRTLTGSLAPGVRGAGEHHAELKSSRVHVHDLRHHRRRLFLALVGVLVFVGALGAIIYQSIAVPLVTVDSVSDTEVAGYESGVQSYLNSHPFERSRLTLNTDKLTAYLQENGFPEIDKVSPDLKFDGLGRTDIVLYARKPVVSWNTTGSTVKYVDASGNAFEKNYFANPAVQVVDQTGIQTKDNQVLVSNRFLAFIGKAVGRLGEQSLIVTKVVLPANTTRQILVSIEGVSYPVKLSVDRPAGEQSEDAARSIKYLTSQGIQPAEYIDVRIGGRAYYK